MGTVATARELAPIGPLARAVLAIRQRLPEGAVLPEPAWRSRHRFILLLLWAHVLAIPAFALLLGQEQAHAGVAAGLIALATALARSARLGRRFQSASASLGLLIASAALVHVSGGYIELHFHFFVMVCIITLYQDWAPYLLAIGYVVAHHGIVGVLEPTAVYNHPDAWANPWKWALIHGAFVLAASVASIVSWRMSEAAHTRAQLILAAAGEGIYGLDRQGRIVFCNPAATHLLQYLPDELLGRVAHEMLHHSRPDGSPCPPQACPILAALSSGAVRRADGEVFWRKDGTSFPVGYVATPIREHGLITGAVIAFTDITERQRAEQQHLRLIQEQAARVEAETAVRARDEFLSVASHELKTPLTTLQAQAQLLLRQLRKGGELDPDRLARSLQAVDYQTDRLARLINQLLDVSRIEAGKLGLEREPTDLAPLLESVASAARARTTGHTIALRAPAATRAFVDPLRLEQVLTNLLENAIKYSPDGGPIELALSQRSGGGLELTVRDHGIGIPPDKRARIFDRFYQAHAEGYRSGMGLGLYISRQIVELHGGQLLAEFPKNGGTRFIVRLPASPDPRPTSV